MQPDFSTPLGFKAMKSIILAHLNAVLSTGGIVKALLSLCVVKAVLAYQQNMPEILSLLLFFGFLAFLVDTGSGVAVSIHQGAYRSRLARVKSVTKLASYALFMGIAAGVDILAKSGLGFLAGLGGSIPHISLLASGYSLSILVALFIGATELASVQENLTQLGFPLPPVLTLVIGGLVNLPARIVSSLIKEKNQ